MNKATGIDGNMITQPGKLHVSFQMAYIAGL